jgi:hypothetical protein
MGFRFRKRIRLAKGLWINLSKKAGSVSVGGRGVTLNISKGGLHETVGLPGTGLSYQTRPIRKNTRHRSTRRPMDDLRPSRVLAFVGITVVVLWILGHLH